MEYVDGDNSNFTHILTLIYLEDGTYLEEDSIILTSNDLLLWNPPPLLEKNKPSQCSKVQ